MSPNDIKRIVSCVVDYSWPWQFPRNQNQGNGEYYWTTHHEQDVRNLCRQIGYGFDIRLAPTHEWDWPIESREGMPCWIKRNEEWQRAICGGEGCIYAYGVSGWTAMTYGGTFVIDEVTPVAPHPLNPTMEPPLDWSPENKRILK